jgi:hypothetical protein
MTLFVFDDLTNQSRLDFSGHRRTITHLGGELPAIVSFWPLLLLDDHGPVRGTMVRGFRFGDVTDEWCVVIAPSRAMAAGASIGQTEGIANAPVTAANSTGINFHCALVSMDGALGFWSC